MKHLPFGLILSRLALTPVIAYLIYQNTFTCVFNASILLIIALLTDVFDGIIARKVGASTEKLRIWDSNVDQIFWSTTILVTGWVHFDLIQPYLFGIVAVIGLEALTYLISYTRFQKTVATHSLLSKAWAISLLWLIIELILNKTNNSLPFCMILGIISRLEIIGIVSVLKEWQSDVPSLYSAFRIRKGLPIKKNTLFNS